MYKLKTEEPEYFFDDSNIDRTFKLERLLQPPDISPVAVLSPDKPWESNMVTLYGMILFDPVKKVFRMWYQTSGKTVSRKFKNMFICYAESQDAINWTKPSLGIHDYNGSDTNIVLAPPEGAAFTESPCIIYDPDEESPDKKYKMIIYVHYTDDPQKLSKSGIYGAFSADGIHWDLSKSRISGMGDRGNICPVKIDDKYVYYGRANNMMQESANCRNCWVSCSNDFQKWSDPELVLSPCLSDKPEIEFYCMSGFPVDRQYLGLLQILHTEKDVLDIELISSRDGFNWTRVCPGTPFLSHGSTAWNSTWIDFPSNGPITIGDQWYWFVAGRTYSHCAAPPQPYGKIGIATQTKNRVVSITAGQWRGTLETKTLTGRGKALKVLWDPQRKKVNPPEGELKVTLKDANGQAIARYQDGIAVDVDKDGWQTIRWEQDGTDLAQILNDGFRIKFDMRDSRLFAYKLSDQ